MSRVVVDRSARRDAVTLPPGQRRVEGFPRFGTHLHRPPPDVPADPVIEVDGAVEKPFVVRLSDLADLPRTAVTADFHCVGGWSATGLQWEGVSFSAFYDALITPALRPGTVVTHLVLGGLDGYRVAVSLEDVLGRDVLIAERLDGRPLSGDHGAPARLVSPQQYGFVNAKHLCRIEVHTAEPNDHFGGPLASRVLLALFTRHPRARVWREERHRHLPGWAVRPLGRAVVAVTAPLSARGSR